MPRPSRIVPERSWVLDPVTGCHEWQRAKQSMGYGQFVRDGKYILAHRYFYEQANGPIPDGMFVCHKCDNPGCVNPEHLFIGTGKDNMQDASRKGRLKFQEPGYQSGERNSRARFTEQDIRVFHELARGGLTAYKIAKLVGCSPSTIYSALHTHWAWIRKEMNRG